MLTEHRNLRLPTGTRARAQALIPALQQATDHAHRVSVASVLRLALAEGLRVLEDRFSAGSKQGADMARGGGSAT